MKKYSILFLLLLFVILFVSLVVSLGYPPRARFFPVIIIIICMVLVVLEILNEIRADVIPKSDRKEEVNEKEIEKGQQKILTTVSWIAALALMIWLFGFIIGLPLYTFIYVKLNGEMWRWAIILSISMLAIVHIGFVILLKMPLYEGLIFML